MKRWLKCKVLLFVVLSSFIACKKVEVKLPKHDVTILKFTPKNAILTSNNEVRVKNEKVIIFLHENFVLVLRRIYHISCKYEICGGDSIHPYLQDFTIYAVTSTDTIQLADTCFKYMTRDTLYFDPSGIYYPNIYSNSFVYTKQEILAKEPRLSDILCLLKNNTYVPHESYFRFMVEYKLSDGVVGKSLSDSVIFTSSTTGK
jgi:hypothetical protein